MANSSGQSGHSSELRIVLIGGRELTGMPSHKSAAGNIILGKTVFDTSKRTAKSVAQQNRVHNGKVTVVDTPGWWWHYSQHNTPKLDQLEIMNSINLCPPGPHVFLLVIPIHLRLTLNFKSCLQEHLNFFHDNVFNHTIVLFTVYPPYSEKQVESKIRNSPLLQQVLEKCENRKHVMDVTNTRDSSQVQKLMEKIDMMVEENGGCHFPVRSTYEATMRKEMMAIAERAAKRSDEVQKQRGKLKALVEGVKNQPLHLRLVLVGAQWSGKSSAGNTILGKEAFAVDHRRTTVSCEINHSVVAGRTLTVVDSPGWLYNHTLQDTAEMDKLEIRSSMHLCPPGPHAVLLVIGLASAFNESYRRAVKEHMGLFGDDVWKHTIVLFTRGDWLGVKTVEERIESEKGLQWLANKCENRYHVLNNHRVDEGQVEELLEKIEEMWAGNKDPHYEVGNTALNEAQREAVEEVARRMRQITKRQSRILKELFEGERNPVTDMNIILVGRKESGKSLTGSLLCFGGSFNSFVSSKESVDQRGKATCIKYQNKIDGLNVSVIETPGWIANTSPPTWLKGEVLRSVSMCSPGPHVFLLVVPISEAYTEEDVETMVNLLAPLGESVWRHCMVLFTWKDWLNNRSVQHYIAGEGQALQRLVERCGFRYYAISCFHNVFSPEFGELFQKLFDIITLNKGCCFTNDAKKWSWRATRVMLTEDEWNKREQKLIDRMMKAIANEPKESALPSVNAVASFDGAFLPSMSEDLPSECGKAFRRQRALAKVFEWRTVSRRSEVTSGFGSCMDESCLTEEHYQPTTCSFPELDRVSIHHSISVETPHRHSL